MYEGGIGVHVQMEKVPGMELPGRRGREGGPRRKYMDVNCEGGMRMMDDRGSGEV